MTFDIGSIVLDGWKIVREIGEGSFGKVYEIQKGQEEGYGVKPLHSALKIIQIPRTDAELRGARSEGMDEQSATSYFQGFVDEIVNEINIMSQLKAHQGIVRCEDYQVAKDPGAIHWDILIRMELLTPLVDYTLDHKLTLVETLRLGIEISDALAHCHEQGLVHRDIKPENMFVDALGHFKLGDFGIARTMEKSTNGMSSKGTESYMAPEVFLAKERYDQTVDIYSLGLVLYRFLNNNRLPFVPQAITNYNDRHDALMRRIKGEPIPNIGGVDAQLNAIIQRACAYDPRQRYQTAEALGDALEAYASERGIQWRVHKRSPEPAPKPKPEPGPAPGLTPYAGETPKPRPRDERGGDSKEPRGTIFRERLSDVDDEPRNGERKIEAEPDSGNDPKMKSRKIAPEPQPQPEPGEPKKNSPKAVFIIGAIVVVIGVALLVWLNFKPGDRQAGTTETVFADVTEALEAPEVPEVPEIPEATEVPATPTPVAEPLPTPTATPISEPAPNPNAIFTFNEPAIEEAVREAIGKPEGDIHVSELEQVTTLDLSGKGIKDISSLRWLTNLTELDLRYDYDSDSGNQISDLTPLSTLTNLVTLYLGHNQVSDLTPLSTLTNLRFLHLEWNQISDITPLSALTNLTYLSLSFNQISDITPLSALTNLTYLSLSYNQISDVEPLSGLKNLGALYLEYDYENEGGRGITNVEPLSSLINLDTLYLDNNQISDIEPLSKLANLEYLSLSNNQISSVEPLGALTNLDSLDLDDNQISVVEPLRTLTNLVTLYLGNNQISDVEPLGALTNLTFLSLISNQVSDLTSLSALTNLDTLWLDDNQISDIESLSALTNLTYLSLSYNQISDVEPLRALTNLTGLALYDNPITDFSPLDGLTAEIYR